MSKSTGVYVHHLVAAYCADLNGSHVGISRNCDNITNAVAAGCRTTGGYFAAWAVGGTVCVRVEMSM